MLRYSPQMMHHPSMLAPPLAPPGGDPAAGYRQQAALHAAARNRLFEQSQAAYRRGDGAAAKKLSVQGRAEARRMEAANVAAAAAALHAHNSTVGRPPQELDLHGLHTKEACAAVEQRISQLRMTPGATHLVCIVGRGNHSVGGVAKLGPAVEEAVRKQGLRVTVGRPNAGCLWVEWDVAAERVGIFGWLKKVWAKLAHAFKAE